MPKKTRLIGRRRNPIPRGAVVGLLDVGKGVSIRYARWKPTSTKSQGTVCLFNGRTEFIEKYFEVIGDLRKRGFTVVTIDWRGQGLSTRSTFGGHGYVRNFDHYRADVEKLIDEVVLPECPPPFFALCHSMGGGIVLPMAAKNGCLFERIMCVSPMVELTEYIVSKQFSYWMAKAATLSGLGKVPTSWFMGREARQRANGGGKFSSDTLRYERFIEVLEKEPELRTKSATLAWANAAFKQMRVLSNPDYAETINVPTLIIAGSGDEIISVRGLEQFARGLRHGRLITIPGANHELLMETDVVRERFWAAFDAFIPGSRQITPIDEPVL